MYSLSFINKKEGPVGFVVKQYYVRKLYGEQIQTLDIKCKAKPDNIYTKINLAKTLPGNSNTFPTANSSGLTDKGQMLINLNRQLTHQETGNISQPVKIAALYTGCTTGGKLVPLDI